VIGAPCCTDCECGESTPEFELRADVGADHGLRTAIALRAVERGHCARAGRLSGDRRCAFTDCGRRATIAPGYGVRARQHDAQPAARRATLFAILCAPVVTVGERAGRQSLAYAMRAQAARYPVDGCVGKAIPMGQAPPVLDRGENRRAAPGPQTRWFFWALTVQVWSAAGWNSWVESPVRELSARPETNSFSNWGRTQRLLNHSMPRSREPASQSLLWPDRQLVNKRIEVGW